MQKATVAAHASWRLTELLDVRTLQAIQDTFARAFGLPTVIVHPDGTDVTDITHRLPFCEDLTRQSSEGGPRCAGCDAAAFHEARDTSRPKIFKCWNGLYDAAIPIAPKGQVLGYFLCGQVLTSAPDPERYRATAEEIGVAPDRYVEALEDVQIVPFERYEASVESMHMLAQMIADQAAASIDGLHMLEEAQRAERAAAVLVEELDSILEALREVSSQPDPQSTLEAIADHLVRLIPADSCVIYLLSEDGATLEPAAVRDPYAEALWRHRIAIGQGVIGKVAATGVARRFEDITRDPDFTPYPGVPVEPESAIAVAMTYNDVTTGVIVLSRFQRRTFTDHDLQVLGVFSSQASVSIQVSRLAVDKADRLREERAFGRLLRAVASPTTLVGLLHEAAHVGMQLLGADAAVLQAETGEGLAHATVELDEREAAALAADGERALGATAEAARATFEWRGRAALAVTLDAGESPAVGVWLGPPGRVWDQRIAAAVALQSRLAIDRVRAHERERRSLTRYQQLAELATSLVHAHDDEEVVAALLARAPETFSAPAAWIARPGVASGTVAVALRHGRRVERFALALEGPARVAALRLRDERAPDATVFDAWSRAVIAGVAERTGLGAHLAEPLHLADGAMGGLFVGWASQHVRPSAEHRRMLGVLAGATGTSLARFAAHEETDSSLRARVGELESLTRLTQRIAGLTDETSIVEEALEAFERLGGLDGATYARRTLSGLEIRRETGAALGQREVIRAALDADPGAEEPHTHTAADGTRVLVLPVARLGDTSCVLAGIGPEFDDRHRGRALHMLGRCAAVALENASLHARQRDAITGLERRQEETAEQKGKLERILSIHETLTLAVLDGRGVSAIVKSLGRFLNAELLVLAGHERVLARQPEDVQIAWRPGVPAGDAPRTVVRTTDEGHMVAAPAVIAGDVLAWVIARTAAPPGDIERAAVEYGALLTALDLLRERMAVEIETRLRGGFLEDLFTGEFHEERMVEQALAMGLDLREPARVYLVEPPVASSGPDPEEFYGTVADGARSWGARHVVAMRGRAVVAVIAEAGGDDDPVHFEDALRRLLDARFPQSSFSIGVGTQCTGVADFRRSFVAAQRGVDLVRGLDRPGETFSFRENTVETMLLQSVEPDAILDFIARYVEPLEAYDRGHALDLVRTLEAYFAAGGNLEEAARRLFVHVSTLRYRLKKVAALTGVDVRDGARSLDLQVALKAADVLRAGSRPSDPAVTRSAARRRQSQ